MQIAESNDSNSTRSVIEWLDGLTSPPLSPRDRGCSTTKTTTRQRRRKRPSHRQSRTSSGSMSQSPKKRQRPPNHDAISDNVSLSDYSLPPPSLSGRVRASSPPRELREIYKYAKPPIRFITAPDENTPDSVLAIYRAVVEKSYVAVIPGRLKDHVDAGFPLQYTPSAAYCSLVDDSQSLQTPGPGEEKVWELATSILAKAKQAFEGNEPEGAWIRIASEALDGVFSLPEDLPPASLTLSSCLLRTMDVSYSDINSATLLPTVNTLTIPVKKADLAIALHPSKSAATSKIYDEIREKSPTLRLSQMSEPSVARMALPACVEVGETGKSYTEASIQLGVWCCAGLLKMAELRRLQYHGDDGVAEVAQDEGSESLVPLLGFTAIGMDWKLHLAYKLPGDSGPAVILGPLNCGGFYDVHSFFLWKEVVGVVARWAEGEFWTYFRSLFIN